MTFSFFTLLKIAYFSHTGLFPCGKHCPFFLVCLFFVVVVLCFRGCSHDTRMCGSRNYPYSPHGRSLEIPRGRGDLKAKLLEGQYEAKQEFCGVCGGAKQKPSMGGV